MRPTRLLLSVLSFFALAGLVIGLPLILIVAVGWPAPDPWPSGPQVGDMMTGRRPIPTDLIVSALAVIMWLLWLQVAWAVVVEVVATFRGRLAGRAPILPGLQLTVGKLVTTATLLTTSLSARPVAAGPLPAAVPVTQVDDGDLVTSAATSNGAPTADRSSGPALRPYVTEPGDTWWGIAEDAYGSGTRWKEIRNLNLGRTMEDGAVISVATDLIRPQWRLLLPAGVGGASAGGDTATAEVDGDGPGPEADPVDADSGAPEADAADVADGSEPADREPMGERDRPQVVVEPGDTLWELAADDLVATGQEPSMVAVAERVDELTELNRAELGGDPDLIFPGQQLDLPARPPLAERSPGGNGSSASDAGGPPSDGEADGGAAPGADGPADAAEPEPDRPAGADELEDGPDAGGESTSADDESTAATAPSRLVADGSAAATAAPAEPERDPASASRSFDPPPASAATPATGGGRSTGSNGQPARDSAAGDGDSSSVTGSNGRPERNGPAGDGDSSPLSPVESTGVPLAGARAESPEWIPVETPVAPAAADAGDLSPITPTSYAADTILPAGSGRALIAPGASSPANSVDLDTSASADGIVVRGVGDHDRPTVAPAATPSAELAIASPSPGVDETLDTSGSRAPVYAGLAAITLVGGYLFRARGRRRKTALQSRHPGRRPAPTDRRARPLTRRLASAAEIEHPDFVNLGLRALGRLLGDLSPEELPKVSGVWVSQNRMVLALAEDSPRLDPPAPFTPFADGSGWSLQRSAFDEIRAIARGANGPLPLLTTVGTTTSLDLALTTNSRAPAEAYGLASSLLFAVDLEAGRVISVEGRRADVVETLMMMAIELATSETADQAEIVCVGFGERLDRFERVMVVDELAPIMADLTDISDRARLASADAGPFATRVGDGAVDTWDPVIVFHANPDDPEARALVDLAEATEGGVTAVCGYPTDSGWRFLVDGEEVNCPELPGSLATHRFDRPRPGEVDEILDLFHEGWDEIDLDEDFWSPLDRSIEETIDLLAPDSEFDPESTAGEGSERVGDELVASGRRRGAPAGPSTEDLPELQLRHSTEHQPSRPPVPTRPGAPASDELTITARLDEEPTRQPGGRHLYVVEPEPEPEPRAEVRPGPVTALDDDTSTGVVSSPPNDAASPPTEAGRATGPVEAGDARDAAGLRVEVLGQFTIGGHHVGDRSKPWKYTKTAELILYLLLHPEGASQDLLMEQLFPDQPTNRPRLNQLVSDARTKALGVDANGDHHLPHASPTEPFYRLGTSVGFDLRDFAHHCARARRADDPDVEIQQWRAALGLVGGRPFTLPHDGYGWALAEIEATIVKVEEAAVRLAELAIDRGDYREAVWATKVGLSTGTGYYELLVLRGRAALLLEDPEEIVRAFADLQLSLDHTGAPEEGSPDLGGHPDLAGIYDDLANGGRGRDRTP